MDMQIKTRRNHMTLVQICAIALAAGINIVGGEIALVLRLPIYLDSIGTIFIGAMLGPVAGLFPSLISGILMGITTDVYSLFFMPAGIMTGIMAGFMFKTRWMKGLWTWFGTLCMTIPGTIISAFTCVVLFGGLTSSGSSLLIPVLRQMGMGETASVFTVQIVTDYADRLVAVILVGILVKSLPAQLKETLRNRK